MSAGPLPRWCAPLTAPASWIYGLAVRRRNARYEGGFGVASVGAPVISVGNITAGGSGKSPMAAWIARRLTASQRCPVIAMRGYHSRRGERGDEAAEYAWRLPEVPVVVDPDRVRGVRSYIAAHGAPDCVILDDGFQHRRIRRDLDLVLVDATRDTMHDRLLPRGWLREPLEGLRRADAVIVTRADRVDDELARLIERHHGRPPVAWSRHAWTALEVVTERGNAATLDVEWLGGRRVMAMAGVGHPDSVIAQLRAAGAEVAGRVRARDHERYDRLKLQRVRGRCTAGVEALVMTGKDWVKTRGLIDAEGWPVPIVVPRLEIDVFRGAEDLVRMIDEALTMKSR